MNVPDRLELLELHMFQQSFVDGKLNVTAQRARNLRLSEITTPLNVTFVFAKREPLRRDRERDKATANRDG